MAGSDVSKKVDKLKRQLAEAAEPTKILKILQKLKDLDITLDILAETGIGKKVKSFREHKHAGEFAKSLVSYWKKLVRKEKKSHAVDGVALREGQMKSKAHAQSCPQNGSLTVHTSSDCLKSNGKTMDTSGKALATKKIGKHLSEKKRHERLHEKKRHESLHKKKRHERLHEKKRHESLHENDQSHVERRRVCKNGDLFQTENQGRSEDGSVASIKNIQHHRNPEADAVLWNKSVKDSPRDSRPVSRVTCQSYPETGKPAAEKEPKKKVRSSQKSKCEESSSSETNSKHLKTKRGPVEERPVCLKHKLKSRNEEEPHGKRKKAKCKHEDKRGKDKLEEPSMSFESCLNYDHDALERKGRSVAKKPSKKTRTQERALTTRHGVKSTKLPVESENVIAPKPAQSNKPFEETKRSAMDLVSIPLPDYLPECDKPSKLDYLETKVEKVDDFCDGSEEMPVFTGQRSYRRMQVYSGAKTNSLPTMLSLYQQCLRAIQNNMDLLNNTGGVAFEILEPVLETCTPKQLLHIEECNPLYVGQTDHLWARHCQRDFRESKLEEYECWKEMYMRLFEEREEKLNRVTKSIVTAHSKKHKGRQLKMTFSHTVAKPPRDVRIQQGIPRTAGAAQQPQEFRSSVQAAEGKTRPPCSESPVPGIPSPRTGGTQDPRKRTRVAPMMAKSIKAFKKQLGRR